MSSSSANHGGIWRERGQWLFGAVWCLVVVGALLPFMASHVVAFRAPSATVTLPIDASDPAPSAGWTVTHVLGADCDCSEAVARYLSARGVEAGRTERVLLQGTTPPWASSLRVAGFFVEPVPAQIPAQSTSAAADPSWDAVPFFQVTTATGELLHSGGYTWCADRSRAEYVDLAVFSALLESAAPASAPIFGCAARPAVQARLDPFSFKY